MPGGLPRGATGSRFTRGRQAFDVKLRGFKTGMVILHKIPGDIVDHFNKDMEKMAGRVLKYAKENLETKVYNPAGVKPSTGGFHQTKRYWLSGNLWKSGRFSEISQSEADAATSQESPNLGD